MKYSTDAHAEADRLLGEIRRARLEHEALTALLEDELAEIRQNWAPRLAPVNTRLTILDQDLTGLEKEHRITFFGDMESCRVQLSHGALSYELTRPVIKRKAVTPEVLEEHGFPDAVKVVKSVDWDALEIWPDARLILVGTERKKKEVFGYDVRDGKDGVSGQDRGAAGHRQD